MSSIHVFLAVTIMAWLSEARDEGEYNLSIYPSICVQPVDNARNHIVDEFLKSDCTHLFFIDSDTIPPPDSIRKMLAHNMGIISGLTPIIELDAKSDRFYRKWNCVGMDDKHLQPNTGVKQVKGAGGSCIMIRRDVFEKLETPYYRFLYEDDRGKQIMVSEDIYFIAKALGKGIEAYCDTSIIAKHYKPTMW